MSVTLQYDPEARLIVVDVKKEKDNRQHDLTQMAYYMEKDVCSFYLYMHIAYSVVHRLTLSFFQISPHAGEGAPHVQGPGEV